MTVADHIITSSHHQVISPLKLPHGELRLPVFLPDATQGVVRAVDSADLELCGVQALVMNTFHLMQRPGSSTIQALGGLHRMCAWSRPIITDSGGFQAYSLIRQNARFGQITDSGIIFRPEGSDRKIQLTPEKSVQLQLRYGADVVICLDDCTHVEESPAEQERAVRRTVAWARRCKVEFERILGQKAGVGRQALVVGDHASSTVQPSPSSGTVAAAGPPSRPMPETVASRTAFAVWPAASICSQVMGDRWIFMRRNSCCSSPSQPCQFR